MSLHHALGWIAGAGFLFSGALVSLHLFVLQPWLSDTIEIRPGIWYKSEMVQSEDGYQFQATVVTVDLKNPRVEVFQPQPNTTGRPDRGHYRLAFPDWLLWRHDLDVLFNTTPFHGERARSDELTEVPQDLGGRKEDFPGWQGWPGRSVWVTEPVITDGVFSHLPPKTDLFWIDHAKNAHIEQKVSRARIRNLLEQERVDGLALGFGLEVIQILDGKIGSPYLHPIFGRDPVNFLIFLGIDSTGSKLILIGLKSASRRDMLAVALSNKVFAGGELDAGHAAWLVMGRHGEHVPPHSGVRGGRPIGAFMGIRSR